MKVLIVDDDVTLVRAVRRGLEAEGFTVETAFDGPEGRWRATVRLRRSGTRHHVAGAQRFSRLH